MKESKGRHIQFVIDTKIEKKRIFSNKLSLLGRELLIDFEAK